MDNLLLAAVSYTPLKDDEVFQHFVSVAAVTDLPLCVYNNPGTTHFTFSNALLKQLAGIARIVAVKNPAPLAAEVEAKHRVLQLMLPADFAIGYSGDWLAPEAVIAGGVAWYSVIGGLLPEPALMLMRAAQTGNRVEMHRINTYFEPLWNLFQELSSYRVVHAAANILGLCQAVPPRPILPLSTADQQRVTAALEVLAQL